LIAVAKSPKTFLSLKINITKIAMDKCIKITTLCTSVCLYHEHAQVGGKHGVKITLKILFGYPFGLITEQNQ